MGTYYLMNKNREILKFLTSDERYGGLKYNVGEIYDDTLLPPGFDTQNIAEWFRRRKAPSNRQHIKMLLERAGAVTDEGYIKISHALTLNDTFWIKEEKEDLIWENVSLYRNPFDEVVAQIAFDGIFSEGAFSSPSPEFSTDGTYAKCWERKDGEIYLIKKGNMSFGEPGCEPYSEYYAAQIAEIICKDAVRYDLLNRNGEIVSACRLFTSEETGFVPFVRITDHIFTDAEIEQKYEEYGFLDEFHRMVVLDALIMNTDRHQGNHGFLVNNETQDIIGAAPIFDNNQSLLSDLRNSRFIDEYQEKISTKYPRIGVDFIISAKESLNDDIISDLKNLKGFKFRRHPEFNLPEERLNILEQVINNRIDMILN